MGADNIVNTWQIQTGIVLNLLGRIPVDLLSKRLDEAGWTIGYEFAHIHNVRVLWLRRQPDLAEDLPFFDEEDDLNVENLSDALSQSAARMGQMLERAIENGGLVEGFGNHVQAYLGYLIAHEYYHIGEIGLIAGRHDFTLPLEVVWNWSAD